jgi:hypothetical protein
MMAIKRWSKISLRALHLLAVAGVGGGILFGLDKQLWIQFWWLALVTGVFMMLIDLISAPVWIVQVRGLVILLKLVLLLFLGWHPGWDRYLLITVIIISAVITHAPSQLRYYSLYHRRVVTSSGDSKG